MDAFMNSEFKNKKTQVKVDFSKKMVFLYKIITKTT